MSKFNNAAGKISLFEPLPNDDLPMPRKNAPSGSTNIIKPVNQVSSVKPANAFNQASSKPKEPVVTMPKRSSRKYWVSANQVNLGTPKLPAITLLQRPNQQSQGLATSSLNKQSQVSASSSKKSKSRKGSNKQKKDIALGQVTFENNSLGNQVKLDTSKLHAITLLQRPNQQTNKQKDLKEDIALGQVALESNDSTDAEGAQEDIDRARDQAPNWQQLRRDMYDMQKFMKSLLKKSDKIDDCFQENEQLRGEMKSLRYEFEEMSTQNEALGTRIAELEFRIKMSERVNCGPEFLPSIPSMSPFKAVQSVQKPIGEERRNRSVKKETLYPRPAPIINKQRIQKGNQNEFHKLSYAQNNDYIAIKSYEQEEFRLEDD